MAAVLGLPAPAYPFAPTLRRESFGGRHPEDSLAGLDEQARLGIALVDGSLQTKNRLDQSLPSGAAKPRLGRKRY